MTWTRDHCVALEQSVHLAISKRTETHGGDNRRRKTYHNLFKKEWHVSLEITVGRRGCRANAWENVFQFKQKNSEQRVSTRIKKVRPEYTRAGACQHKSTPDLPREDASRKRWDSLWLFICFRWLEQPSSSGTANYKIIILSKRHVNKVWVDARLRLRWRPSARAERLSYWNPIHDVIERDMQIAQAAIKIHNKYFIFSIYIYFLWFATVTDWR